MAKMEAGYSWWKHSRMCSNTNLFPSCPNLCCLWTTGGSFLFWSTVTFEWLWLSIITALLLDPQFLWDLPSRRIMILLWP